MKSEKYKMYNKIFFLILILFFIFMLPLKVSAIGLNYQTESIVIESGKKFCLNNYYIFNTEPREMSAYLEVDGDLIKLTPYYQEYLKREQLRSEIAALQENYSALQQEINQRRLTGQDVSDLYDQLGVIDSLIVNKGKEVDNLNSAIDSKRDKFIITVPGLDPETKALYNTSAALRAFLQESGRLKQAKLCLEAPEIEKEIKGECHTKFYYGNVVLVPIDETTASGMGSSVAMRVSAPLTVQVRCKAEKKTQLYLIIGAVLIIIIILIIILLLRRRKSKIAKSKKRNK